MHADTPSSCHQVLNTIVLKFEVEVQAPGYRNRRHRVNEKVKHSLIRALTICIRVIVLATLILVSVERRRGVGHTSVRSFALAGFDCKHTNRRRPLCSFDVGCCFNLLKSPGSSGYLRVSVSNGIYV